MHVKCPAGFPWLSSIRGLVSAGPGSRRVGATRARPPPPPGFARALLGVRGRRWQQGRPATEVETWAMEGQVRPGREVPGMKLRRCGSLDTVGRGRSRNPASAASAAPSLSQKGKATRNAHSGGRRRDCAEKRGWAGERSVEQATQGVCRVVGWGWKEKRKRQPKCPRESRTRLADGWGQVSAALLILLSCSGKLPFG